MQPIVLLASQLDEDREFAQGVAKSAGLSLIAAKNFAEAAAKIKPNGAILLVGISSESDVDAFVSQIGPKIGIEADQLHPNFVHLICNETPSRFEELLHANLIGNYLIRMKQDHGTVGQYYGHIVHCISARSPFDLSKQSKAAASEVESKTIQLKHSQEKKEALDEITAFLGRAGCPERIQNGIITAVDELLMNAIYDAPTQDSGKQVLKEVSRSTPMPLSGKKAVELRIQSSPDFFAFTVTDQFGSLKRSEVLKHALADYRTGAYAIDNSKANAGLGLSTIFHRGGSLFYLTEQGKKTEATALFKRASSFREFQGQFRFVSVQMTE